MINTENLIGYNLDIMNNSEDALLFIIIVIILYAAIRNPFIRFRKRTTTIVYGRKKV